MLGTVVGHDFAHVFVELLSVLGLVHVYEVNYNDAAHVAQTQLPGNLVGSTQIYLQGVGFLVVGSLGAVAGVYVDYVQSLGMLYDYVGAGFERNRFSEARFNLTCNREMVENRFGS